MLVQQVVAIKEEEAKWYEPGTRHREGSITFKRYPIDTGLPGLNFAFVVARVQAGYYTPRHRHNYDQIRYVLQGADLSISNKRVLKLGECGYFPESCYYGPQQQTEDSYVLTLQFPGPSAMYFMSFEELDETYRRLQAERASFAKGVYRGQNSEGQTEQKDGYEAIWEAHQQRPLVYTDPRYDDVVVMRPENYEWLSHSDQPGLWQKHLGTFNELRTSIWLTRWEAGYQVENEKLAAPEIRYLLSGSVEYAGESYGQGSCFYLPRGTSDEPFSSTDGAQLFVISLPMVNYWQMK